MITILITQNSDSSSVGKADKRASRQEEPKILLLREGLRMMGLPSFAECFIPDMLARTEDGKPFFPELPDIHFNFSHSGEYVACAFSDMEIGLDLQEHRKAHTSILRIAKRFFTSEEYEAILALPAGSPAGTGNSAGSSADPDNSADRLLLFYRFWTIKEAYLKYLGCGLRGGMNGYLPDPFPVSGAAYKTISNPLQNPASDSSDTAVQNLRGQIRVICNDPLLTPAVFALTQAPENYSMAVCAERLPDEIFIKAV